MNKFMDEVVSLYDDSVIRRMLTVYFEGNEASRIFLTVTREKGWQKTVDHLTIRCLTVDIRAREFLRMGYQYEGERIEYPDQGWWAQVYRKKGYPALFLDQAYDDERGTKSLLPRWVKTFGEDLLHHIGVLVRDIEEAKAALEEKGVEFSGEIVGARGTRLRQIFTAAELRGGEAFSVLELTERNGYEGFVPAQADSLMQSSLKTKSG